MSQTTGGRMVALVVGVVVLIAGALPMQADTFGLFISGLGGDEEYSQTFLNTGRLLYESAVASGMDEGHLRWFAERSDADRRIQAESTRTEVLSSLERLQKEMKKGDLLWLVLIGHGSYRDGASKINLPGPDLTDRDLAQALANFPKDRYLVFVNTASASGGFLAALSGDGRVVVTATKSAAQRNQTVFGTFFAAAFLERKADTDQDGFVSALEAFSYANEEVQRHYDDGNLLVTENALLDDNGDGEGSLEPDPLGGEGGLGDGPMAARLVLGASALSRVQPTTENLALLDRKGVLQRRLDALRRQKSSLAEDLYLEELQSILVEIARIDRELRTQTPKSSEEPVALEKSVSEESGSEEGVGRG